MYTSPSHSETNVSNYLRRCLYTLVAERKVGSEFPLRGMEIILVESPTKKTPQK